MSERRVFTDEQMKRIAHCYALSMVQTTALAEKHGLRFMQMIHDEVMLDVPKSFSKEAAAIFFAELVMTIK